jgi:hypothetical protein
MKEQWLKGLQWGSLAAVSLAAWQWLGGFILQPMRKSDSYTTYHLVCALGMVAFFALAALTWSPLSRAYVLLLIGVVLVQSASMCAPHYVCDGAKAGTIEPFSPSLFVLQGAPALPMLPMLFVDPECPRLTVALAFVGRFRDAARMLAGWRWPLVGLGVFYFNRTVSAAAGAVYWDEGAIKVTTWDMLVALGPCAALFGVAALPRPRKVVKGWW